MESELFALGFVLVDDIGCELVEKLRVGLIELGNFVFKVL